MRSSAASLADWRLSAPVRLGAQSVLACADVTTSHAGQIRALTVASEGSSHVAARVFAITGNPFAVRPDGESPSALTAPCLLQYLLEQK